MKIESHILSDDAEYEDYFRYARGQGLSTKESAKWAQKIVNKIMRG